MKMNRRRGSLGINTAVTTAFEVYGAMLGFQLRGVKSEEKTCCKFCFDGDRAHA